MKAIQLVYVENVISRHKGIAQQELFFFVRLQNLGYDKQVEVLWCGEDGLWQTAWAQYHSSPDSIQEYWKARAHFSIHDVALPGNLQLAVRCRIASKEYWDNNEGQNYFIDADCGVWVNPQYSVLNFGFPPALAHDQKLYPISVAVHKSLRPRQVYVHWTTSNWKNYYKTPCFAHRSHWDKLIQSNARNPNRYGYEVWTARLKIEEAYRLEYAIGCETERGELWENNFGLNYLARRENLKVLTLNLHCYQEENQDHKFSLIAQAINELDADIVCLQEVGENWNNGQGDWESNAAKIIRDRLRHHYYLHLDWAHIGFDRYREGVAILSKFPFLARDAGYVSTSHEIYSIHSRKVVMAQVRVPYMGVINIFSAHLSWWNDGFRDQFTALRRWANSKHTAHVAATLLCGDFNIKAGSQGYQLVVESNEFEDQFLRVTSPKVCDEIFRLGGNNWERHLNHDHRIDYIWAKKGSQLKATTARVLFTEKDYGPVSDHPGYFVTFEPK